MTKKDSTSTLTPFSQDHGQREWEKNYPVTDETRAYWDTSRQALHEAQEAESNAEDTLSDLKSRLSRGDSSVTAEDLVVAEKNVERTRTLVSVAEQSQNWLTRRVRQDENSMRRTGRNVKDQKAHNALWHSKRKLSEYRTSFPRRDAEDTSKMQGEIAGAERKYNELVTYLDEMVRTRQLNRDAAQAQADEAAAIRDETIAAAQAYYPVQIEKRAVMMKDVEDRIKALTVAEPAALVRH